MINTVSSQTLSIMTPNTNKALELVLKNVSPQELERLSQGKDLNSILNTLLQRSANDASQDQLLLNLLKNNTTLKDLGNVSSSIKDLLQLLKQDKNALPLEKTLTSFLSDIKDISEKGLKSKLENSGIFLENKIKNSQPFSDDFKAILLKTHHELSNSNTVNRQEILKHVDKLLLQIDYYQLASHLSNATSLYVPYSWEGLEDGKMSIKNVNTEKFFTDIELRLKEYGELKLRLGLFEKNQLSININAESEELKSLLQENLPILKKQLFDAGITPKDIRFLDEKQSAYDDATQDIALGFEVKA